MTRSLSILIAGALLVSTAAAQRGIGVGGPSSKPDFSAAVMTTGTSLVGADSRNWAYIVWNSPGAATLAGKAFSVNLQTAPGGGFTRVAVVTPTADVPALSLLIDRAANIGANNAELNTVLRDLLRKKSWAGQVDANNIATNASSFDAKPLAEKLSAVMGRAMQSTDALAALMLAAPAHPLLRMALGRAWAAPLPAGAGPMTIELREWSNGTDGGVVGRVTLTPGQGVSLVPPGKVVQVPDLKPSGDLTVKIRWAVPDAMRRQQQHVLGFKAYRILQEDAAGLNLNATTQQIIDWVADHPLVIEEINDAPVPIATLFNDLEVSNLGLGGDRTTFFIADDAHRGAPVSEAPNAPLYQGFNDGQHCLYYVCAVDLLGRKGPPSPLGQGVALRTIPPDVPSGLTVADLPVGANNERRLRLRWRANGAPANAPERTTQLYAIYRGNVPDGAPSNLFALENPFVFTGQVPIAFVNQSELGPDGYLTFVDDTVQKTPGNTDRSVWYALTAIHETELDWFAMPMGQLAPHYRVQSAPSAPAFGIFRDREGPPAPSGGVYVNCDKLVTRPVLPLTTATRDAGSLPDESRTHLRLRCTRRNHAIVAVRITITDRLNPPPVGLVWDTQWIAFPPGKDEVVYEISPLNEQVDSPVITCRGVDANGAESIVGLIEQDRPVSDAAVWNVYRFITGRFAATEFGSDSTSPVADLAVPVAFQTNLSAGPGVRRATFNPGDNLNGQTVLLQRRLIGLGTWGTFATAQVAGNEVVFPDASSNVLFFQYRAAKLPAGGDCKCAHDARPPDETEIQPITVYLNIPATTKEWRILRSVDGGPLALAKSGIIDLNQGVVDSVITQDKAMPPNGAVMRYFGQCFDQNNNPSPLKFLAEVPLLPAPGTPVLNPPSFDNTAGENRVVLKWFCPAPGVKRFRVTLVPLGVGESVNKAVPVPANAAAESSYGSLNGVPLMNLPYILAGEKETKFAPVFYAFDLPPLAGATLPLHTATFRVTPDQTYVAWISAMGFDDMIVTDSKAHQFIWKTPVAQGGAEPVVPWPARPLPPVEVNPLGDPFLMTNATFPTNGSTLPGFIPERSSISNWDAANLYPVGIRIGVLPYTPDATRSLSDVTGLDPPVTYDSGIAVLEQPPDKTVTNPANFLVPGMMPCALFRQTVLDTGLNTPGALVQVSPLREAVAWKQSVSSYTAGPDTYYQWSNALRDPFVKALTYDVNGTMLCWLNLVDTHSVEAGATYHYYLVSYGPDGEINRVWDCGQITIPED